VDSVRVEGDTKTVLVGNSTTHVALVCKIGSAGCITPVPNRNYLLLNKDTRWQMPGTNDILTLAFVQSWTRTYDDGENIGLLPEKNIGLVPEESDPGDQPGLFVLDRKGADDAKDVVWSDGPITYGTGLNDAQRADAWKRFFRQIANATLAQQGADALRLMLARKCEPGQDFCITRIDADLAGIGGNEKPTKVLLTIATDLHDANRQILRMICTWPTHNNRVCRNWDTGKLVTEGPAAMR
jgi:hypothetical protein